MEKLSNVKNIIEDEGMDYCFMHYSNFEEIKDKKFHELRKAYVKAAIDLQRYVVEKALEEEHNKKLKTK
jgi:hypothetical protein